MFIGNQWINDMRSCSSRVTVGLCFGRSGANFLFERIWWKNSWFIKYPYLNLAKIWLNSDSAAHDTSRRSQKQSSRSAMLIDTHSAVKNRIPVRSEVKLFLLRAKVRHLVHSYASCKPLQLIRHKYHIVGRLLTPVSPPSLQTLAAINTWAHVFYMPVWWSCAIQVVIWSLQSLGLLTFSSESVTKICILNLVGGEWQQPALIIENSWLNFAAFNWPIL